MTSLLCNRVMLFCAFFQLFNSQAFVVSAFARHHYRDVAFTWSSPVSSPRSRPQLPPSTQPIRMPRNCVPPLCASSSSSNDGSSGSSSSPKHHDVKTPKKELHWNLPVLLSSDPNTMAKLIPLMDVYNAAVSQYSTCHDSLEVTGRLPPSVAPYRRFVRRYNRDMGHDGRFTVFSDPCDDDVNDSGASLQADVVFSMENPLAYIRDKLSYRAVSQETADSMNGGSSTNSKYNHRYRYDSGTKNTDGGRDEAVVFVPGLHTFHEDRSNSINDNDDDPAMIHQRTTTERVQYYSQVLDDLPMAQIHQGTYLDQGDIDIELTSDTMQALKSFQLLRSPTNNNNNSEEDSSANTSSGDSGQTEDDDNFNLNSSGKISCGLRAQDLDVIRTVLSRADTAPFYLPSKCVENNDTARLKKTIIKLIDTAVKSSLSNDKIKDKSPHLVLITYSATSVLLAAALTEWKHQAMHPSAAADSFAYNDDDDDNEQVPLSEEEVDSLLRQSLTVVTIGALCKDLIDGPAYIHVSMHDDALAASLGTSKRTPEGGGRDAVYLHGISPYLTTAAASRHAQDDGIYANDAHSMDACAIQYLSLIRRINGLTSFRTLFDLANDDGVVLDVKPSLFSFSYRTIGQLEMPPHLEGELLPSMIRATGGERWLWNTELQLGEGGVDGFDSPLPSLYDSEAYLTQQFGYSTYDVIRDSCFGGECYNF